MISIVLYGRNDNYGYNLHKRAALSLNCMAEVLSDPLDEILFVDYNTPDDFPTFPEAIQDTLTQRAKRLLRILRVRPRVHERFKSRTRLLALEPIARNVAVRRSDPSNRWILSTNTDMIFVPLRGGSLSEIAQGLAPGFYHTPRIEIPEVLWESLDRSAPLEIIDTVRDWGSTLHLNEIVLGSNFIRYDGPGDFQLLLRSDLFENHGFDEEMLLGWHVDSNIAARMLLKYRQVGDLGPHVYGYHCDHTRQVTPAHSHLRVQNDWIRFVTEVARADIPAQSASWGCADDPIEELRLPSKPASAYVQVLRGAIGEPLVAPKVVQYIGELYNKVDYDARHLLPFLADMFVPLPRACNLVWYGARAETFNLFAQIWERLGFTGTIFFHGPELQPRSSGAAIKTLSSSNGLAEADAFVFDFGGLPQLIGRIDPLDDAVVDLLKGFRRVVRMERSRIAEGRAPRRIIALNAINNDYEGFVCGSVGAALTPFATHMRHGFVLPPMSRKESWLPSLGAGEAGIRVGDQLKSDPSKIGWIAYGPFKFLEAGTYLVSLNIELLDPDDPGRLKTQPCVFIEVRAGSELLSLYLLRYGELKSGEYTFHFSVPHHIAEGIAGIETRIAAMNPIAVAIRDLAIEPTAATAEIDEQISTVLRVADWLPFLRMGSLGRVDDHGVISKVGSPNFVVWGPYWALPIGKYEMCACIEREHGPPIAEHLVRADVVVGKRQLIAGNFHLTALSFDEEQKASLIRLPFELHDPSVDQRQIETRIWSSGESQFRILSLSVKPVESRQYQDFLPFMLLGEAGLRIGAEIRNMQNRTGFVAYSPSLALEHGTYKLSLQVIAQVPDSGEYPCAIALVKNGADILAAEIFTSEAGKSQDRDVVFEISSDRSQDAGFQILLQVVAAANVRLRTLTLESTTEAIRSSAGPAVCRIDDWLPFLQTTARIRSSLDSVLVEEGAPQHVLWGPFWTLPTGHYELIATVAVEECQADGEPFLGIDIVAEGGRIVFAAHQWRLGQLQSSFPHTAVELRLPFALSADLPAESRTVETRVHASSGGRFRVYSLAVRQKEELGRNWFPYLAASECGIHTGREIKSVPATSGCIAKTPAIRVEPGHYKVDVDCTYPAALDSQQGADDNQIVLEIWSGPELMAAGICRQGQSLEFDAPDEFAAKGIEARFRACASVTASIQGLQVVRTSETYALSTTPAALRLSDWLPFLQRSQHCDFDCSGLTVDEGKPEFACWGPYWTLPPGRFDLVASIVPRSANSDVKSSITLDVTTSGGQRPFARQGWRLEQFQRPNNSDPIELTLPFTLGADLPEAMREIETRILTSGEASFRVESLTVRAVSEEAEHNWLPYLIAGECAIHTGSAIRSIDNKIGCIASTPPIDVVAGRYEMHLTVAAPGVSGHSVEIEIEIRSQSEIRAIESFRPEMGLGCDHTVTFDVASADQIELAIRTTSPTAVTISALRLRRTSPQVMSLSATPVVPAKTWRNLFRLGAVGLATPQGILAQPGATGTVGYLWVPYHAGRYETVLRVKRVGSSGASRGQVTIIAGEKVLAFRTFEFNKRHLGPIAFPRGPFRICSFAVPADPAREGTAIRIRINNTSPEPFLIRSISIKPATRLHDIRDRAYITARNIFRWLQSVFESWQSARRP